MKRMAIGAIGATSGLLFLVVLLLAEAASAAGIIADQRSNCTAANCQATVLNQAVILSEKTGTTIPFTVQFWSTGNECVRVEALNSQPSRDLTMHLIGPDLSCWRDDDSGAGLLPRIEANTYAPGHYTLVLGYYSSGSVDSNTRVKLSIGRYPRGNPNCSNPTYEMEPAFLAWPESEK